MKKIILLASTIIFYLTTLHSQSLHAKKIFSVSIGTVNQNEFNSATIYSSGAQKTVPVNQHSVRSEIWFGKTNTKTC